MENSKKLLFVEEQILVTVKPPIRGPKKPKFKKIVSGRGDFRRVSSIYSCSDDEKVSFTFLIL
jgi:hypothetical protein